MIDNRFLRIKRTIQTMRGEGRIYLRSSCSGMEIEDRSGLIGDLIGQLDGTRSVAGIGEHLAAAHPDAVIHISAILEALDDNFLLEDMSAQPASALTAHEIERWSRNLDFLDSYCHASENKFDKQMICRDARIGLLGLGGLGSHLLFDLAAFGFSTIRAVDFDKIELANLNRQILYREFGHWPNQDRGRSGADSEIPSPYQCRSDEHAPRIDSRRRRYRPGS